MRSSNPSRSLVTGLYCQMNSIASLLRLGIKKGWFWCSEWFKLWHSFNEMITTNRSLNACCIHTVLLICKMDLYSLLWIVVRLNLYWIRDYWQRATTISIRVAAVIQLMHISTDFIFITLVSFSTRTSFLKQVFTFILLSFMTQHVVYFLYCVSRNLIVSCFSSSPFKM